MKKRFLALAVLCLVLCTCGVSALAVGTVYEIKNLGISVEIPIYYRVEATDDELYAFNWNNGMEIFLSGGGEVVVDDFKYVNDSDIIDEIIPLYEKKMKEKGFPLSDGEIYKTEQEKYIRFRCESGGMKGYVYVTFHGGKTIAFLFGSLQSTASLTDEESIINSLRFVETEQVEFGEAKIPSALHSHTNDDGLSYELGENWYSMKDEESGFLYWLPTDTAKQGNMILMVTLDLQEEYPAMKTFTRSYIDKMFREESEERLNTFFGTDAVTEESMNGIDYYCVEYSSEELDEAFANHAYIYVHLKNARFYTFWYVGDINSPCYADFQTVLSTALFPD